MTKQLKDLDLGMEVESDRDDPIAPTSIDMPQPAGIKKRLGSRRRNRLKSPLELGNKQRKKSKSMSQPVLQSAPYSQSQQTIVSTSN